jgi:hypothetical protein
MLVTPNVPTEAAVASRSAGSEANDVHVGTLLVSRASR